MRDLEVESADLSLSRGKDGLEKRTHGAQHGGEQCGEAECQEGLFLRLVLL